MLFCCEFDEKINVSVAKYKVKASRGSPYSQQLMVLYIGFVSFKQTTYCMLISELYRCQEVDLLLFDRSRLRVSISVSVFMLITCWLPI